MLLITAPTIIVATLLLPTYTYASPLPKHTIESQDSVMLLAARDQISNALSKYAFFVDSKQFDKLDQVFAPDGSCYFPKPYPRMQGSTEIIEVLRNATVNVHSQHLMGSFCIDVVNGSVGVSHS
jgi:hypothetical protein